MAYINPRFWAQGLGFRVLGFGYWGLGLIGLRVSPSTQDPKPSQDLSPKPKTLNPKPPVVVAQSLALASKLISPSPHRAAAPERGVEG